MGVHEDIRRDFERALEREARGDFDVAGPQPGVGYIRTADEEAQLAKGGAKFDAGKDPWHLAPWDAFRAVVKVLAYGAKKYADRNWEKGMAWSRPYAALQRHITAWWEGESKDPETGYSHLWHAGACIMFLIAYEMRGAGTDDRPYSPEPPRVVREPVRPVGFIPPQRDLGDAVAAQAACEVVGC